ncbi:MAG: aminoacyl-tRNA hydrolase [Dongiaceae bacterium]
MRLLVGLGNPGSRYTGNRHNIGFMALDAIARRYEFSGGRSRFNSLIAEGSIGGEKLLAIKPQTYMNDSGRALQPALQFYKLGPEDVIVIHDEIDLPLGRVRVKRNGGAAGHNGLRSIDAAIGPDYWRIRLGVGHPGASGRVRGFVLDDFSTEEMPEVARVLDAVAEAFPLMVGGDPDRFRSRVDVTLNPPPPKPDPAKPDPAAKRGDTVSTSDNDEDAD